MFNLFIFYQSFSSDTLRSLVERTRSSQKIPFTSEMRKFAITLQFYSSRAYDYVRKSSKNVLPHQKTITKWYKVINGNPGFTSEAFE